MDSIFDIPVPVFGSLSGEQKALVKLLDDPSPEVYASVSLKLIEYGKRMTPVMTMIYDFARMQNNEVLENRTQFILRQYRVNQISEIVKYALTLEKYIEILILVDEIILMQNLEKDFILEELEGMKKQLWLNTNFYMPKSSLIDSLHSVYYNLLNFEDLDPSDSLTNHTFIHTFYNRQATDFMQLLTFGILTDMIMIDMEPIIVDHRYLLALPKKETTEYELVVEFPGGQIYNQNVLPKYFTQEELNMGSISKPHTKYKVLINKYLEHIEEMSRGQFQEFSEIFSQIKSVLK